MTNNELPLLSAATPLTTLIPSPDWETRTVFVYGTLMSDGYLHPLLAGTIFLGPTRTKKGFALVDMGDFPALISNADFPNAVEGEAYNISEETLRVLDRAESEGWLYVRRELELHLIKDNSILTAQVYLLHPQIAKEWPLPVIEKGIRNSTRIRKIYDGAYRWQNHVT